MLFFYDAINIAPNIYRCHLCYALLKTLNKLCVFYREQIQNKWNDMESAIFIQGSDHIGYHA